MFESFAISIISKIAIEKITKTTKVVIELIEKEFASNEDESNWRNIVINVALSIVAKTTINESITNRSDWDSDSDFDSHWDSDSNAESFLNIDEFRNAEILFLSIFLTRNLRSRLTISSRRKAEAFVSRLSRKLIMNKKFLTVNNFNRKVWREKKLRREVKILRFYL